MGHYFLFDLYDSLVWTDWRNKRLREKNEREIENPKKRTLELEKRHNIACEESKEPFLDEFIEE